MTAETWQGYLDKLAPAGDLHKLSWRPDDPLVEAEVQRQLMMNLSLGYFCYFGSDPAYPDFVPFLNSVYLLQPNPDDAYFVAFIDGKGRYRITGERGSVHLLTLSIGKHMMGCSEIPVKLLYEIDADTVVDADGRIDLILSAERPEGYTGAWHVLPPDAEFVNVRQRSYRWGEERDACLAITPLDLPSLKPRLDVPGIDARMNGVVEFAERLSRIWLKYLQGVREKPVHEIRMTTYDGGVQAQQYWEGIFDIQPDEALILETDVPKRARYWNIQLNDVIWNTIDYVYRQSSLNGAQASIDEDGRFRAVISPADPGVPNWLDTGGNTIGTLVGRWYECDSHPHPTLRKVKLSEVRDQLPASTRQVSREERSTLLLARARGAQLRRRW